MSGPLFMLDALEQEEKPSLAARPIEPASNRLPEIQAPLFGTTALPLPQRPEITIAEQRPPMAHPDKEYSTPIRLLSGLNFSPVAHNWYQTPEERELVSASISQTWTDQAMRCFMTGADCATCDIPKGNYAFACQMDKVVPVLLDSLGLPDPHRLKRIYPQGFPHTAY
jgi:hypothetical protein